MLGLLTARCTSELHKDLSCDTTWSYGAQVQIFWRMLHLYRNHFLCHCQAEGLCPVGLSCTIASWSTLVMVIIETINEGILGTLQ